MKKIISILMLCLLTMPVWEVNEPKVHTINRIEYSVPAEGGSNYLTSVTIENIDFEFNRDITRYIIDVPFSKDTLGMAYAKEDENATVEFVGNEELAIGSNTVAIIVTNAAGEVREYDFTINRSEDRVTVLNEEFAIDDAVSNADSSKLVVELIGEGAKISKDAITNLKNSKKTLVYEWKDADGNTIRSISFNGESFSDEEEVNPNFTMELDSEKLAKKLGDIEYVSFNTKDTNIPSGTMYTVYTSNVDESYVLYSDKDGVITNRSIKNENGALTFSIDKDTNYALVLNSLAPSNGLKGFGLLWTVLIIFVLLAILGVALKYFIPKIMRKSQKGSEDSNSSNVK